MDNEIEKQMAVKRRVMQREAWALTPAERLERFAVLQAASFNLLQQSPEGYRHFLQRNLHKRRVSLNSNAESS